MQSKITDASAHALRLRQMKNNLKQKIFKKYQQNKSKAKKVVSDMLLKYRSRKAQEYSHADKKIRFYRDKYELNKLKKEIPVESSEFLKGVNIFSPDVDVKPQDPLGPFICDPSIKLNADELNILSRGPKFMIRSTPDEK